MSVMRGSGALAARAAIGIVLCASGVPVLAQDDALKARLDAALKTIEDLQARVKALEAQRAPAASAAAAAAEPAEPPPAPVVAPDTTPEPGTPGAEHARVELYGQVMLDAIYDFKRMSPNWQATLRPSQIPVGCPGQPGCGKDGSFVFSVRQSMLGVRGFIPTNHGLVKTDVSFDLFDADGGTGIHWLRVWGELGPVGFGQTETNFMDLDVFPPTIDYWGPPGMVFLRNPQLRFASAAKDGVQWAVSLEAPGAAIDTGKLTAIDPSFGSGFQAHNRLPDLVGSVRLDRDWGHVRAAAMVRQVGFQNVNTPGGNPSGEKTGYGLNVSGTVNLAKRDKVSWQLVGGHAIASYMNDGGTDLAPGANFRAEAVRTFGWLAYYGHAWNDAWQSAVGFSEHRQGNTDGQLASAFRSGRYGSVNVLFNLSKNLLMGSEYVWGRHETKDGASATDHRIQFSTKATF